MGHKSEVCNRREFIVAKPHSPELGDNFPTDFSSVTDSSGLSFRGGVCTNARGVSITKTNRSTQIGLRKTLGERVYGIIKLATTPVLKMKARKLNICGNGKGGKSYV